LILQGASRLAEAPEVASRIEQALDDLDLVVRQVRSSIFDLHDTGPSEPSLRERISNTVDSLRDALGHTPILRVDGPIDSAVPTEVGDHLVAVVSEALANVARHADASISIITVALGDGDLRVVVDDDGVGPGPRRAAGRGLGNLVDRAEQLGGRFSYEPGPHAGTRVTWVVPIGPGN
jgi:signal transduction histidine kinase